MEEQVDQADNTHSEEKSVGLNIANLQEAKGEAKGPHNGGTSADQNAVDQPAVNKRADFCKATLNDADNPEIEIIDIEEASEERDADGSFSGALP